jgi:hypothetical protein
MFFGANCTPRIETLQVVSELFLLRFFLQIFDSDPSKMTHTQVLLPDGNHLVMSYSHSSFIFVGEVSPYVRSLRLLFGKKTRNKKNQFVAKALNLTQ